MHKGGFWIEGLVPAVFTPMDQEGEINLKKVKPIVEHLLDDGVNAIYVCGSTGEGPSLSTDERKAVTEAYIEAVNGRIPVIVQVGHNSIRQAFLLAKHAQKSGANAISSIPPTYFKVQSLKVLFDCLEEIVVGAPDLPFYYYHIPRLTSLNINAVEFLSQSTERLPSMVGIKYSDFKIFEFQACLDVEDGRFNMLFGSDEMLLSGLVAGAHGAVGSTFNFAAPLYKRILETFQAGEIAEARRLQSLSVDMVGLLETVGSTETFSGALKAMMGLIALDCGPIRLPQLNLTPTQVKLLKQQMEAIGFFEWGRV